MQFIEKAIIQPGYLLCCIESYLSLYFYICTLFSFTEPHLLNIYFHHYFYSFRLLFAFLVLLSVLLLLRMPLPHYSFLTGMGWVPIPTPFPTLAWPMPDYPSHTIP